MRNEINYPRIIIIKENTFHIILILNQWRPFLFLFYVRLVKNLEFIKSFEECHFMVFFFYLRDNVSLRHAILFWQNSFNFVHGTSHCCFVRQCQKFEIHTAVGPRDPQCDGRLSDIKSLKHFFYGDTSTGGSLVWRVTHSEFLLLARFQLDGPWRMGFEYSICRD